MAAVGFLDYAGSLFDITVSYGIDQPGACWTMVSLIFSVLELREQSVMIVLAGAMGYLIPCRPAVTNKFALGPRPFHGQPYDCCDHRDHHDEVSLYEQPAVAQVEHRRPFSCILFLFPVVPAISVFAPARAIPLLVTATETGFSAAPWASLGRRQLPGRDPSRCPRRSGEYFSSPRPKEISTASGSIRTFIFSSPSLSWCEVGSLLTDSVQVISLSPWTLFLQPLPTRQAVEAFTSFIIVTFDLPGYLISSSGGR